jgi:hypothetical protein
MVTALLACSEITVSKTSQLFFWASTPLFHQRMAPPAATAPPGVSNPHDARAVARIERVHELRKEALATGTSPLPDYDDVPVRSRRARIWKISKPREVVFVFSSHLPRTRVTATPVVAPAADSNPS